MGAAGSLGPQQALRQAKARAGGRASVRQVPMAPRTPRCICEKSMRSVAARHPWGSRADRRPYLRRRMRACSLHTRTPIAILGAASLVIGLVGGNTAVAAAATDRPQIVMFDPASSLSTKIRQERSCGNAVDRLISSVGEDFVATLDAADVARLTNDPDVLMIEPNRPERTPLAVPITDRPWACPRQDSNLRHQV